MTHPDNLLPEQALARLVIQVSPFTGISYFHALLKALSGLLEADIAIVAEIIAEGTQARTVSVFMDGEKAENFEFELNGSPFTSCNIGRLTMYPKNVVDFFPDDYLLIDLSVEGFAAMPLVNSQKQGTGFLAVMFHSAIVNQQHIEPAFGAIAERVAAELDQKREFDKLREIESYFIGIADLTKDVILVITLRGEIRFASFTASALFGHNPGELTGHHFCDLLTEDTRLLGKQEFEKFIASGETQFNIDLKVDHPKNHTHAIRLWVVKTNTGHEVTGCVGIIEGCREKEV